MSLFKLEQGNVKEGGELFLTSIKGIDDIKIMDNLFNLDIGDWGKNQNEGRMGSSSREQLIVSNASFVNENKGSGKLKGN